MGLVNCRDCGGTISTNANMCPHCGTINTIQNEMLYEDHLEYEHSLAEFEHQLEMEELEAWERADAEASKLTAIMVIMYVVFAFLFLLFIGWVMNDV